jgi:hypothetical protein
MDGNPVSLTVGPAGVAVMTLNGGSGLLGVNLRNQIVASGSGFDPATAAAAFGATFETAAACDRVVVDAHGQTMTFRTPLCAAEGPVNVWIQPSAADAWAGPFPFWVSGAGYRVLKSLQAPGRYTQDPADPGNVILAAAGRRLDLLESSRRALVNYELFPKTAVALLWKWEAEFSIPTNLTELLATRQARVHAAWVAQDHITLDALNTAVAAYVAALPVYGTPLPAIAENGPYGAFGELVWQGQIYEPSPNYLSAHDWRYLLALLARSEAGWTRIRIGNNGFMVGSSMVGRDFV